MERFDNFSDFVEWSQDIHSEVSIHMSIDYCEQSFVIQFI